MAHPSDFRRPAEDAYGDGDDEVVTYGDRLDEADPRARQPIDVLIEAEEALEAWLLLEPAPTPRPS